MHFESLRSPFLVAGICLATLTAVGATTLHRLSVTQTTGSEGAQAFVNTSPTGSAIQANSGSAANTSLKIPFGIFGEYAPSSTQFGIGVIGISTTGYGVAAETFGNNPAMLALQEGSGDGLDIVAGSGNSNGISISGGEIGVNVATTQFGIISTLTGSFGGSAISGYDNTSTGGTAVGGSSENGVGGFFESDNTSSALVALNDGNAYSAFAAYGEGINYMNSAAIAGVNTLPGGGSGFLGAQDGSGVEGVGEATNAGAITAYVPPGDLLYQAIEETNMTAGHEYTPEDTFEVQGSTQNRSGSLSGMTAASDLQVLGDVYLTGSLYTGCSAYPAVSETTCTSGPSADVHDSSGRTVEAYASSHASRTIEDEGETMLVNGFAHVALDPTFASTISMHKPYLVFLNAWGDTRGLYSLHRTQTGFDVRENGGGRSTLSFDYRIVAKPFDDRNERMTIRVARNTAAFVHRAPMHIRAIKPRIVRLPHVPGIRKLHYTDLVSQ